MFCDSSISIQQKLSCFSKYFPLDIQEPLLREKRNLAFTGILLLAVLWSWLTVIIPLTKPLFSWISSWSNQCHRSLGREHDKASGHCLLLSRLFSSLFLSMSGFPSLQPAVQWREECVPDKQAARVLSASSTHRPHDLAQDIVLH